MVPIPTKYLPLVAVLLLLSVFQASGNDVIPSKCDDALCQHPPPSSTPLSDYPSYGAPPPPTPPSGSGYSIYSAPPPPAAGHSKCPPAGAGGGVQCCTPPATYTYAPPATYTYAPPYPYTYAPPYPYTYVPYGEAQNSAPRFLLQIIAPLMMLYSSFI